MPDFLEMALNAVGVMVVAQTRATPAAPIRRT